MDNQEMVKQKKGRAKYEWLVLLVIVVAVIAVAVGIYVSRNKTTKAEIMMSELEQMRASVMTYKTLNKTNPPNLATLTTTTYEFSPGETPRPYLSGIDAGADGALLDPFGHPYEYDANKGWVFSSTDGYQGW
jgi:hypothetical protein